MYAYFSAFSCAIQFKITFNKKLYLGYANALI